VFTLLVGFAGPVDAHTGFDSSDPADGDIVDVPVEVVTIVFTGPATPVGDGFVALDPDGQLRSPSDVSTADDMTFDLEFDPPLAGGAIGIRWEVQAPDTHPVQGAFSFTVTAPVPTTSPSTTLPPPTTTGAPDSSTTVVAPETTVDSSTTTTVATSGDSAGPTSLEDFLAVDNSRPGETTQLVGRVVTLLAAMVVLGGIVFLATTFRGSEHEIGRLVLVIRILGVIVAVGAVVEYIGYVQGSDDSFASAWSSSPGAAMAFRFIGALLVAAGLRAGEPHRSRRWHAGTSPVALVGAAAVLASFWFDGHTVTEGIRPLHALVDTIHVAAGASWMGGIVLFTIVVWNRSRRGEPTHGAELVVRFSHVATLSLVAVIAAGALMAVFVLDSFGELTSTEWGQILLLKAAAVGLAACFGGYNHLRLRPALEAAPDDPVLAARLRSILTAEAIVLTFVVIVTAWLVAAAT
jgi:copper transport protein